MNFAESPISVSANDLRSCTIAEAVAFVDETLGTASAWGSSLIAYRLSSDFQEDWKTEVGCWLWLARELGFLDALLARIARARNEAQALHVTGPNDSAHRILLAELAPAMVTYYFVRQGWRFVEWEPSVHAGDVDVRLICPRGVVTDMQVKAPDQPGELRHGRIHDGEYDTRVLAHVDKALKQLQAAPGPQRIAVLSPQRTRPIRAGVLARHLYGRVTQDDSCVVLRAVDRGVFASNAGHSIGAVVDLSLLRGVDEALYRCTAFVNPWAETAAAPNPDIFRDARVCRLEAGAFMWHPEEPQLCFGIQTGLRYVE
jgi:hypothetical protein